MAIFTKIQKSSDLSNLLTFSSPAQSIIYLFLTDQSPSINIEGVHSDWTSGKT